MRIFTKAFLLLSCTLGVLTTQAKTEKVHATFEAPSNTNTTWDGTTKTFTWSTTWYNQLRNIGLPSGDITKYKKLVVDCDIKSGDQFRILFYKGGSNITLYASNGVNEFILADTLKAVAPNDYNEYMKACDEICLSGNNQAAPGEAVINDVYLETYDDEGEKVYATFEDPTNTNTTWDGTTKTFTWSTTWYNQLRNIGLPNGDITKYKKLVVDCDIKSGDQFRILFYKGGSNITLYASNGVNEFILADTLKAVAPDDYNEYMKACDEICLSGNNQAAPGEAVINSVYLETYPENESVEIPDIVVEQDPGRPEGEFTDLTTDMYTGGNAILNLGKKIGNGEMVYGIKSKDAYADLAEYEKLTIVATPGLKLVLNLNHNIDVKENLSDYADSTPSDYVWIDAVVGEDGKYELDLTQYDPVHLNNIRMPWDNSNKGTIWYLLLTKKAAAPASVEATFDFNTSGHATSASGNTDGDITDEEVIVVNGVTMTITKNPSGTANRYWGTNNGPQLRMYGGTMTIVAPEGKAITKVVIDNGKWNAENTFNGVAAKNGEWEGNSTNVVLAVAGNTQMNKVVVTIADKNEQTTTYAAEQEESIANTAETAYTVAKAVELIEAGKSLTDVVFVKGIVSKVDAFKDGAITYWISDDGTTESQQFECYKGKGINGADFTSAADVEVGATVVVTGLLTKYTPKEGDAIYEFKAGNTLVSYEPDETTAINAVNTERQNAVVYNLNGQRVAKTNKGLYIVNGKKMFVK